VINAGWDHNQALISLSYDKLIDPAQRWRSTPTVIADDAKRAGRRKQAVHEEAVNSPPPDSTRKCGGQIYLNNWSFRHPPIGSKDFREMAMAMGHGAREATPNALN
jgi:hypothetical protein